jgi:hypothetical protein
MSKPVCIFQSAMWTRSGYGDLGISLAKSLLRYDKFDLKLVPTKWGGCSRKYLIENITEPTEKELFGKILREPLQKQPEIFMHCTIPNEFQGQAKYNIGITAGIETTIARADWIDGLNRMNLNLVTSQHAKDVFEKPSYTIQRQAPPAPMEPVKSLRPMEVQFWGVDTNIYKKTDETMPNVEVEMAKIKEDFCFLFVGQWTSGGLFSDRKDIGNLIKTFMRTFSYVDVAKRPALILKTSGAALCNMDRHDIVNRLTAVKNMVIDELKTKEVPNVYLIHGELTEVEMNALYNHNKVKAHISFTHGEGYGHPLLLSTMSGKPLLVSNWSGHLDFLDKDMCKLLDGDVAPLPGECVNEWLIQGSSWFSVNYSKAEDAMKNCLYNYGAYLRRAEDLRIRNVAQFSNEAMDKRLHGLLDKYVPQFATETKLVLPKLRKLEMPPANKVADGTPALPEIKKLVLPQLKKVKPVV